VKKLIALLLLVLLVFVVVERKRVYVRDVLASAMRDGQKVSGEQVYINYYDDVLLENDNPPMLVMLVEHGQPIGVPTKLRCIHWVACLTDAEVASTIVLDGSRTESMDSKAVKLLDEQGRRWVVTLH
jgi:hypothetical protein